MELVEEKMVFEIQEVQAWHCLGERVQGQFYRRSLGPASN